MGEINAGVGWLRWEACHAGIWQCAAVLVHCSVPQCPQGRHRCSCAAACRQRCCCRRDPHAVLSMARPQHAPHSPDLVERIAGVGDQLTQENLLVAAPTREPQMGRRRALSKQAGRPGVATPRRRQRACRVEVGRATGRAACAVQRCRYQAMQAQGHRQPAQPCKAPGSHKGREEG